MRLLKQHSAMGNSSWYVLSNMTFSFSERGSNTFQPAKNSTGPVGQHQLKINTILYVIETDKNTNNIYRYHSKSKYSLVFLGVKKSPLYSTFIGDNIHVPEELGKFLLIAVTE